MLTQYFLMTLFKVIYTQVISPDLQYQNLPYTLPNLNLPAVTRNVRQITNYQSGLANNLPSGLSNYNHPNGLSSINLPNNIANDLVPSGLANTIYPNNGFVTNMGYNGNNFQNSYSTLNSAINSGLPSYFANNMASTQDINRISQNNLPFGGSNYNNAPFTENIPPHAQNMVQNYNIPKSATNIQENGPRKYNPLPSNIPQSNFGSAFYNTNNANSFSNSGPNTLLNNGGMENIVRKSNLQVNNMPINGLSTLNNIASNLLASSTRANSFDHNRLRLDNGLSSNSLLNANNANSLITNSNTAPYSNGVTSMPNNYGFYQNNLPVPQGMPTNAYNWNNNILPNHIQGTNSIRHPPNDGLSMSHNNMVLPVTNIPCTNAYLNKGSIGNMPLNTVPQNVNISPTMHSDMTPFNNGNFGGAYNINSNDFYPNVGLADALTLQDNWSIPPKNFVTSTNNFQLTSSLPLNILSQGSLMNFPPEYNIIN